MQIDKQQIFEHLEQQGRSHQTQQVDQALPQQLDTNNMEHQDLLQKFDIDPQDLEQQAGGGGQQPGGGAQQPGAQQPGGGAQQPGGGGEQFGGSSGGQYGL